MEIKKGATPAQMILVHTSEAVSALNYLVDELTGEQKKTALIIAGHLTGITNEAIKIANKGNNPTYIINPDNEE